MSSEPFLRLANHTGVSLLFTIERSLNKSCDLPISEAAVRQVRHMPSMVRRAQHIDEGPSSKQKQSMC